MTNVFDTIFCQPLLETLLFFYELIPGGNFGIAIILLTILIKILLFPLNWKSLKSQQSLNELQPKLEKIKERFKNDKEALARETMTLYKKNKVNPFSGFLLLLIQMPILIALYQVFRKASLNREINSFFLGLDLSQPNILLAVIGSAIFFVQMQLSGSRSKLSKSKVKKEKGFDFPVVFQKQMNYFLLFLTFLVLVKVSSAISLYLIVSTMLSILQMSLLKRRIRISREYVQEERVERN